MNETSFASLETKVYRFNSVYRVYHFAVGIAALVGAAFCYHFLALSAVFVLFAVFMIARPLLLKVTLDKHSVTFKGTFRESSLQCSSITSFERIHTGKANYLMLHGTNESEYLTIPVDMFRFDDAWHEWLCTYRDLSDDKPMSLF